MKEGKYFHRCSSCGEEWYDESVRSNYCLQCLSQREARRKLRAQDSAVKAKATLRITNLMHKYGRRIKLGS